MTTDLFTSSPHWAPNHELNGEALQRARLVVEDPAAVRSLARYYATVSNYAGKTFLDLEPNDPDTVSATDLLAVTTLSVEVGPLAIRTFERESAAFSEKLAALPVDLRLETMDPLATAEPMASFYELVKKSLRRGGAQTSNAWVTASKICARKRPNLFPVRDNIVLDLLGLPKTYPVDWPAFRALVSDENLMGALDEKVAEAARQEGVEMEGAPLRLRHLDVVLWMHTTNATSRVPR